MYKSSLLHCVFAIFLSAQTMAQVIPTQTKYLNINNVSAAISADGDLFVDTLSGDLVPAYEFPKGSGKMANGFAGLIICALDTQHNSIGVAGTEFTYMPIDFWPGPLDDSAEITSTQSAKWNKVWVVTAIDINSHRANQSHTFQNTAVDIITWPAFGNVHAQGYGGALLVVDQALAPFIDYNQDGIYNFEDGDYPNIKGDQALWCVFNDFKFPSMSGNLPIHVQVSLMAYAHTTNDLLNDAIFLEYEVVKKKENYYDLATISLFSEADFGKANSVYVGSDSCRRMGIVYKPTKYDEVYHNDLTMQGIALTKSPGDSNAYLEPLGAVASHFSYPQGNSHYFNLSTGKSTNGLPTTRTCSIVGNGPICPYVYPDDPSYSLGASDVACGNQGYEQMLMVSTKLFTFQHNKPVHVSYCIFNTPLGSFNDNFNAIRARADTLLISTGLCNSAMFYPAALSNQSLPQISLVPNPAHQFVSISASSYPQPLQIFNTQGQIVHQQVLQGKSTINLSHWPASVYYVKLGASTRLMVVE
jgi:hypothetical protein